MQLEVFPSLKDNLTEYLQPFLTFLRNTLFHFFDIQNLQNTSFKMNTSICHVMIA